MVQNNAAGPTLSLRKTAHARAKPISSNALWILSLEVRQVDGKYVLITGQVSTFAQRHALAVVPKALLFHPI